MQLAGLGTITLETGVLILSVLLIRKVFGTRLHPLVLKGFWGLVALRILLPVQFKADWFSGWNIGQYLFRDWRISATTWMIVWLVGMLGCALLFVLRNANFISVIRKQREIYGKKDGVLVYFVDSKIGSCLVGLLFPRIYISRLAEDSFDWCSWIVRHELCHYHARDNWYSLIRNLCLIVQWFNPLVWYGAKCSVEDFELACDYRVLRQESEEAQVIYGKCLLAMATGKHSRFFSNAGSSTALSRGSLKRRFQYIGRGKGNSNLLSVSAFACLALLTLCLFFGYDSAGQSALYQMSKLPVLEEKIFCYELEDASEPNMNHVLKNMQVRSDSFEENIMVFRMDNSHVGIILPLFDEMYLTTGENVAEHIANGSPIFLKDNDKMTQLSLTDDTLFYRQNEDGQYELWLTGQIPDKLQMEGEEYRIYFGDNFMYKGLVSEITDTAICIGKERYFDTLYDTLELLLSENPCRLNRK